MRTQNSLASQLRFQSRLPYQSLGFDYYCCRGIEYPVELCNRGQTDVSSNVSTNEKGQECILGLCYALRSISYLFNALEICANGRRRHAVWEHARKKLTMKLVSYSYSQKWLYKCRRHLSSFTQTNRTGWIGYIHIGKQGSMERSPKYIDIMGSSSAGCGIHAGSGRRNRAEFDSPHSDYFWTRIRNGASCYDLQWRTSTFCRLLRCYTLLGWVQHSWWIHPNIDLK